MSRAFCSLSGTGGKSKLEEGGNTSGVLTMVPQVMIGLWLLLLLESELGVIWGVMQTYEDCSFCNHFFRCWDKVVWSSSSISSKSVVSSPLLLEVVVSEDWVVVGLGWERRDSDWCENLVCDSWIKISFSFLGFGIYSTSNCFENCSVYVLLEGGGIASESSTRWLLLLWLWWDEMVERRVDW